MITLRLVLIRKGAQAVAEYTRDPTVSDKCYVCGQESNITVVDKMDQNTGYTDSKSYCWKCFEEEMDKSHDKENTTEDTRNDKG